MDFVLLRPRGRVRNKSDKSAGLRSVHRLKNTDFYSRLYSCNFRVEINEMFKAVFQIFKTLIKYFNYCISSIFYFPVETTMRILEK